MPATIPSVLVSSYIRFKTQPDHQPSVCRALTKYHFENSQVYLMSLDANFFGGIDAKTIFRGQLL